MRIVKANKYFLLVIVLYFVFRLGNLTLLPIFNDESIYLDWGWREVTIPGHLFYSLYDAKQPLLMWLFGISMHFFQDSLFAGRVVSVLLGLITLCGIYKIGKNYYNNVVGIIASLLYIVIPLFSFYDRQALMEAAVSAIGVWSLFFFLEVVNNTKSLKSQVWFGFILGLGMMVKTNVSIFIIAFIIILGWFCAKKTLSIHEVIIITTRSGGIFLLTVGLLFIQPLFWQSLAMNSKYSLTLSELLRFPIVHTFQNIFINTQIIFIYITPLVVVASFIGMYFTHKNKKNMVSIYWFALIFVLQAIFVRETSHRYIISFLPILMIFAAYSLYILLSHSKKLGMVYLLAISVLPTIVTTIQIISPVQYFKLTAKVTNYSDISGYIQTANSGYGAVETIRYLKDQSKDKNIYVATALNTGNPESAVRAYLEKDQKISVVYFDSQMFDKQLYDYDCLQTSRPFYFISRDEQQAGLNKFFSETTRYKNHYGTNSIGVYTLKHDCEGKILPIDLEKIIQYENQQ